jgi:hypothetical protein
MKHFKTISRGASALALGGLLTLGGCDAADELLRAENPERINESQLDNKKLADVLANSVIGEFQRMYADPFIWRASMLTDEQVTGINWEGTARLNQRLIRYDEGDADLMFSRLSASRAMADTVSGRLRNLLDAPTTDARLATALAYGGYSYVLMAETLCEASINLSDRAFSTDELFQFAVVRLEEALQVAEASNRTDLANLARVGLARAHLGLGNEAEVKRYAAQVPEDFVFWVEYSDISPEQENILFNRVTGGNHALGVHPKFVNGTFGAQDLVSTQTDPRIQHTTKWTKGHNGLTKLYKPFQPLSYSGFNGAVQADGGKPILFEKGTDIKLASGLEARHHAAEADGPTAVTLAFVNERRAFGNQAPVDLSGAALMAELREQRGRDLYLGGFRLGDLRRWKAQGVDLFPAGTHPNEEWGAYGDATCFPIPLEEYNANPNLPKPKG